MADVRKLIQSVVESLNPEEEARLKQNIKAHLLGGTLNIPIEKDNGRGGTETTIIREPVIPAPYLYQYLFQLGFGKAAVAEPEPKGADPFKELEAGEKLSDEEMNARLDLNVPPPPDEFVEGE